MKSMVSKKVPQTLVLAVTESIQILQKGMLSQRLLRILGFLELEKT